jgi:flavoprotein hydroxylase
MLKAEGRPEVALPPIPPPVLGPGVLADEPAGVAGQLSPQGRVRTAAGVTGRFDQVVGTGFVVASGSDVAAVLDDSSRARLKELGTHVVRFVSPGEEPAADNARSGQCETVVDLDGVYLSWLSSAGYEAVAIRPDFYVFGGVSSASDLPALLDELAAKVGLDTHAGL